MVLWGDSIGKGVVLDEVRGRYVITPCSAASMVAKATGIELINRCRMGMTVGDGLATMQRDLNKGLEADAAVIEFGGNDCDFDWGRVSLDPTAPHLPKTPFEQFSEHLCTLIEKVRSRGMTPFLVNLPPLHAEKYFAFISGGDRSPDNILRFLGDKGHIYRFQERYSLRVNQIAQACNCRLLDIRSAFLDLWNTNSLFCRDGIHPNTEGQRFIGQTILAQL